MRHDWPEVPLEELLVRSEDVIDIVPTDEYKEVTIRLWGNGVVLRRIVAGSEFAATRRFQIRRGQFLLSRIDARNGALGVVPGELDGAVVSNDFPAYNCNVERLDSAFLNWLSKTRRFVELCRVASEGTTNRVRLQESRFLRMTIPLPPLSEQRRIVAKIEQLAAKIEEARGLREQSVSECWALEKSTLDRLYHRIACNYGLSELGALCRVITDGDHLTPKFCERGVPFIFVGNVSSGRLHFVGCKYVAQDYFDSLKASRKPERGDVLYSAVGATLGIPVVVDTDCAFCFQRHIAIIKPNHTVLLPEYLCHMLRSTTLHETAWRSTTGSAQPTIPLRAIRRLQIPAVPLREQRDIAAYFNDLQAKVGQFKELQAKTATEIGAMLPSVLDKAFKGEL